MNVAKSPFRRFDTRSDVLEHIIEGQVLLDHESLGMIVRDISDHGLKIEVSKPIEAGEQVRISLAHPVPVTLVADVRWCRESGSDGDLWHVGLRVENGLDVLGELQRLIFNESGGPLPL